MLAVFSVLASTYLGKCVHRQWTSRAVQVSNNSTSTPDIALNISNQTEYEQIQNVEYEDPERYLPASHDDSRGGSVNNSEEKIDSVIMRQSLELLSEEALVGEHKSENVLYENQSNSGVREADDLYLTPITWLLNTPLYLYSTCRQWDFSLTLQYKLIYVYIKCTLISRYMLVAQAPDILYFVSL